MNKIESAVAIVKSKIEFAEEMMKVLKKQGRDKNFTALDFYYAAWHNGGPYAEYNYWSSSVRRSHYVPAAKTLTKYGVLTCKKAPLSVLTPLIYCYYHFEDGTSFSSPQPLSRTSLASSINDHGNLVSMDTKVTLGSIEAISHKNVYNFTPEFAADPKKFMRDNMTRLVMEAIESVLDN